MARPETVRGGLERGGRERETLIFGSPEEADAFAEQVEQRVERVSNHEVRRDQDVLGEAVAEEFSRHGEAVDVMHQPWEHTPAEHQEVQQLVDVAFTKDLAVALKRAQSSDHYPRTLDLFHDVLTGQLYEVLVQRGLNQQSVRRPVWGLGLAGGVVLVVVGLVFWWLL